MELVELLDEVWVHDVGRRDPGELFRNVPLPVHQILEPMAAATGSQESMDRVDRAPLNESGGRWGSGSGNQSALPGRLDLADVE